MPPFDIASGASADVTVDYTPTAEGATNGTLFIVSDNPVMTNTVLLTGFGVQPVTTCTIIPSKSSIDFGNVTVGTTNVVKTTISNIGLTNCTIFSISLTGSNDLALIAPQHPVELGPNGFLEVGIRYTPTNVSISAGTLEIVSSDESNTVQTISMDAVGGTFNCRGREMASAQSVVPQANRLFFAREDGERIACCRVNHDQLDRI